jgi:hypothetical protein
MLLTPRKVFTGVKVLRESKSGLYNETSLLQAEKWQKTFNEKTKLPLRTDVYHVQFSENNEDGAIVLFKTQREKEIQIGREYDYPPMELGECKIVKEDESAGGGAKEGQIIFMKIGPINLMPYVDAYEQENTEQYDGRLKPIIKSKKENDPKKIIKKEQKIINSYV